MVINFSPYRDRHLKTYIDIGEEKKCVTLISNIRVQVYLAGVLMISMTSIKVKHLNFLPGNQSR